MERVIELVNAKEEDPAEWSPLLNTFNTQFARAFSFGPEFIDPIKKKTLEFFSDQIQGDTWDNSVKLACMTSIKIITRSRTGLDALYAPAFVGYLINQMNEWEQGLRFEAICILLNCCIIENSKMAYVFKNDTSLFDKFITDFKAHSEYKSNNHLAADEQYNETLYNNLRVFFYLSLTDELKQVMIKHDLCNWFIQLCLDRTGSDSKIDNLFLDKTSKQGWDRRRIFDECGKILFNLTMSDDEKDSATSEGAQSIDSATLKIFGTVCANILSEGLSLTDDDKKRLPEHQASYKTYWDATLAESERILTGLKAKVKVRTDRDEKIKKWFKLKEILAKQGEEEKAKKAKAETAAETNTKTGTEPSAAVGAPSRLDQDWRQEIDDAGLQITPPITVDDITVEEKGEGETMIEAMKAAQKEKDEDLSNYGDVENLTEQDIKELMQEAEQDSKIPIVEPPPPPQFPREPEEADPKLITLLEVQANIANMMIDFPDEFLDQISKNAPALRRLCQILHQKCLGPEKGVMHRCAPIILAVTRLVKANATARHYVKYYIFQEFATPPPGELNPEDVTMAPAGAVSDRLFDRDPYSLRACSLRLICCMVYELKKLISDFFWYLLEEDTYEFIRLCGFGNAVGLLTEKGLPGFGNLKQKAHNIDSLLKKKKKELANKNP